MLEFTVVFMLLMPVAGAISFGIILIGYYMAHRHDSDI